MKYYSSALAAIALLTGAAPSQAQTYTLKDLGAAPGESVSVGYGLNEMGQAAGTSSAPSGAMATLFSNGLATNLGTLEPNDVAIATGISRTTEVVGYEFFSSTPNNTSHAFVYSNGRLLDIHSPSLFPAGTMAEAVNGLGDVVGEGLLNSSSFHAFLYANGKMVDIGPPGSYQAFAVAINDAGQIVGNSYFTNGGGGAFIYLNGAFTFLAPPRGAQVSVFAVNRIGEVVGEIYASGTTHAAIFVNGSWTDLGALSGSATHATGINTQGQVIATAIFPQVSYHPPKPGKHVGLIFIGGALVDLNTLIPAGSGFTITDAIAINDAGEILCNAKNSAGVERAVLLTPK